MRRFSLKQKIDEFLSRFSVDIGVDLGTSNTLFYLKDKGIVIEEASLLARRKLKRWTGLSAPTRKKVRIIAYGQRAREMVDREAKQIEVIRLMKRGVVSDLEALENYLDYYLKLIYEIPSRGLKLFKPRIIVGVPGSLTDVERRAVRSVFLALGVKKLFLVEQSLLAGIGMGLSTKSSSALLIVDVGGAKTEASIVSSEGMVLTKSLKFGGDDWDDAIVSFLKMKYGMLISRGRAEKVKREIGCVWERKEGKEKVSVVRGRDLGTALPRSLRLRESEVKEALMMLAMRMVALVKELLDQMPEEVSDDVLNNGIRLVGGGAKLRGLDKLIEKESGVPTGLIKGAELGVIRGCEKLIKDGDFLEKVKVWAINN
ncbi:hypothetical protein DRH14_00455 [Candidatus Shapirobacteria bacterium]|nr:MAG: hypothetical protein DRH14_00455 [Candidatus Shapirobacteria bacterium]